MSSRNFVRKWHSQIGMTPARFVEEVRFEAAKRELMRKGQTIDGAAQVSGLQTREALRRLFKRRIGMTPRQFRSRSLDASGAYL